MSDSCMRLVHDSSTNQCWISRHRAGMAGSDGQRVGKRPHVAGTDVFNSGLMLGKVADLHISSTPQAFTIGTAGAEPAWRVQLEGWEAATHVRLAIIAEAVSAAAITYECALDMIWKRVCFFA